MKCQRCLKGEVAEYRVYSDAIDMKVCSSCAKEAGELGITVEVLDFSGKKEKRTDKDLDVALLNR